MSMDLKAQIFQKIKKKGVLTARSVSEAFDVSRNYANLLLRQLREEGEVVLVGKTNQARYVFAANKDALRQARRQTQHIFLCLQTKERSDAAVL